MTISGADLALLEGAKHTNQAYFNVWPKREVASATIADLSITYPLFEIDVTSESAGWVTDTRQGMLFEILDGSDNVVTTGVIRKPLADNIAYIDAKDVGDPGRAKNIEASVQNGYTIKVYDMFPLWTLFSTIRDGEFYKRYDVAYTDDQLNSGLYCNIGEFQQQFADEGTGLGTFSMDASDSYDWLSRTFTYLWTLPAEASLTSGTLTSSAIEFTLPPGFYIIYCDISNAAGSTFAARPVWVNEYSGDDAPFNLLHQVKITSDSHPMEGRKMTLEITGTVTEAEFPEGGVVFLSEYPLFDGSALSSGAEYVEHYVGMIELSTRLGNRIKSALRVDLASPFQILDQVACPPQWVEEDDTPENWTQVPTGLATPSFINWYLLAYHCENMTNLFDYFELPDGVDPPRKTTWSTSASNLASQLREVSNTTRGNLGSESAGTLRYLRDPMLEDATFRAAMDTRMEILPKHLLNNQIEVAVRYRPNTGVLRGYAFAVIDDELVALEAKKGIEAQGQGQGKTEEQPLVVRSQDELNIKTGNMMAAANAPVEALIFELNRNMDIFDPARDYNKWVEYNIPASYDPYGVGYDGRGIVTNVEREWREIVPGVYNKYITITVKPETQGEAAGSKGIAVGGPQVDNVALPNADGYWYQSSNYRSSAPTWERSLMDISGTPIQFIQDPFDTTQGILITSTDIYKITNLFSAINIIEDVESVADYRLADTTWDAEHSIYCGTHVLGTGAQGVANCIGSPDQINVFVDVDPGETVEFLSYEVIWETASNGYGNLYVYLGGYPSSQTLLDNTLTPGEITTSDTVSWTYNKLTFRADGTHTVSPDHYGLIKKVTVTYRKTSTDPDARTYTSVHTFGTESLYRSLALSLGAQYRAAVISAYDDSVKSIVSTDIDTWSTEAQVNGSGGGVASLGDTYTWANVLDLTASDQGFSAIVWGAYVASTGWQTTDSGTGTPPPTEQESDGDFENSSYDGAIFSPDYDTYLDVGYGMRGAETNNAWSAFISVDFPEDVELTYIYVDWYCPRNSSSQSVSLNRILPSYSAAIWNSGGSHPVGRRQDSYDLDGMSVADRFGSQFQVECRGTKVDATVGLCYRILIQYKTDEGIIEQDFQVDGMGDFTVYCGNYVSGVGAEGATPCPTSNPSGRDVIVDYDAGQVLTFNTVDVTWRVPVNPSTVGVKADAEAEITDTESAAGTDVTTQFTNITAEVLRFQARGSASLFGIIRSIRLAYAADNTAQERLVIEKSFTQTILRSVIVTYTVPAISSPGVIEIRIMVGSLVVDSTSTTVAAGTGQTLTWNGLEEADTIQIELIPSQDSNVANATITQVELRGQGVDPSVGTDVPIAVASHFPGAFESARTPGTILTSSVTGTSVVDGFVSTDHGTSYSALGTPNIVPTERLAGEIVVPYENNTTEYIAYYGGFYAGVPFLARVESDGVTNTVVSPIYNGVDFGPWKTGHQIQCSSANRLIMCVVAGNATLGEVGVFVSEDGGDTWIAIVVPSSASSRYERAAMLDDKSMYLYGAGGAVGFISDFVSAAQDKRGNIVSDFPSIDEFVGIAGI